MTAGDRTSAQDLEQALSSLDDEIIKLGAGWIDRSDLRYLADLKRRRRHLNEELTRAKKGEA
jgi:hypothetical protein